MKFVIKHLPLKIFSLLFAIFLHLYFFSPENSEKATMTVNIRLNPVDRNTMVVHPVSGQVSQEVIFRGPAHLVQPLSGGSRNISLSLDDVGIGRKSIELDRGELQFPAGVEIVSMKPSKIEVEFEHILRRKLNIVPKLVGEPAENFKVAEVIIRPRDIFARGPKRDLQNLKQVETKPIDIAGLDKSREFSVSLVDQRALTTLELNFVTVDIKLREVQETKDFKSLPIVVKAPKGVAASVSPTKANIQISGSPTALKNISQDVIKLYADCSGLGDGAHQIKLSAELPKGIELESSDPSEVTVNLSK